MKVVAITGIDGSGKTTFTNEVVDQLSKRGVKVREIDIPYYKEVDGFDRVSKIISFLLIKANQWASKHLVALVSVCSLFFYPFACLRGEKANCEVLVVGHHPRVDFLPYAELYGGKLLGLFGWFLVRLFRAPDWVILIDIAVETALDRIMERGKTLQPHENPAGLTRMRESIGDSVRQFNVEVVDGNVTQDDQFHVNLHQKLV